MSKSSLSRILFFSSALLLTSAAVSQGEVIITFSQSGSNVVAQGSGTLNVSALTLNGSGSSGGFTTPDNASVGVGSFTSNNLYQGFTGPVSFGTGAFANASAATGNIIGIEGSGSNFLITPLNYVSGSSLLGTATWDNTTIAALGLTAGTYTWTWGSAATADSFEVIIPGTATPEPASVILAGGSIGVLAFGAWIRRRRSVAEAR